MIDLSNVPAHVSRLGALCLVHNVELNQIMAWPNETTVDFIEGCGMDIEDYIAALRWLSDYHAKHAEALRNYAIKHKMC